MGVLRRMVTTTGLMLTLAHGASLSGQPPRAAGTIAIEAKVGDDGGAGASQVYVNTASRALGTRGFVILNDPEHALYVAELTVSRTEVGLAQSKVGAGKASMLGSGVSIPIARGRTRLVPLQRTRMEISIRKRGENQTLWRGAAVTIRVEGSRDGTDEAIAPALSEAIVGAYPNKTAAIAVP